MLRGQVWPAMLVGVVLVFTAPAGRAQCCGDCDGDGAVAVSELITAVTDALNGCPMQTPRPTEVRTPTVAATVTPTCTPARFVDNRDGTITDLVTGLMWEKKIGRDEGVDGFELHDADNRYPWSGTCTNSESVRCYTDEDCPAQQFCIANDRQRTDLTIFAWVEEVNRENGTGFARFADWRVPCVEELRTLRQQNEAPPMTNAVFNAALCGTTCMDVTNPACSCTAADPYWTTTSFAPDVQKAWRVDFAHGDVLPNSKWDALRVRAVRGP
jgi:hypothetical protein